MYLVSALWTAILRGLRNRQCIWQELRTDDKVGEQYPWTLHITFGQEDVTKYENFTKYGWTIQSTAFLKVRFALTTELSVANPPLAQPTGKYLISCPNWGQDWGQSMKVQMKCPSSIPGISFAPFCSHSGSERAGNSRVFERNAWPLDSRPSSLSTLTTLWTFARFLPRRSPLGEPRFQGPTSFQPSAAEKKVGVIKKGLTAIFSDSSLRSFERMVVAGLEN